LERGYDLDIKAESQHLPKSSPRRPNPIKTIFIGELQSQVKCLKCGYCSNTIEPMYDLSLDISKNPTLETCISRFFKPEKLTNNNKYQCSKCNKKVDAEKRYYLKKVPNNLIIQFKRFDPSRNKISKPITYPDTLDLKPFIMPSEL
jgi:ubiquitin carboxyl-terminal hydrolase 36/42